MFGKRVSIRHLGGPELNDGAELHEEILPPRWQWPVSPLLFPPTCPMQGALPFPAPQLQLLPPLGGSGGGC